VCCRAFRAARTVGRRARGHACLPEASARVGRQGARNPRGRYGHGRRAAGPEHLDVRAAQRIRAPAPYRAKPRLVGATTARYVHSLITSRSTGRVSSLVGSALYLPPALAHRRTGLGLAQTSASHAAALRTGGRFTLSVPLAVCVTVAVVSACANQIRYSLATANWSVLGRRATIYASKLLSSSRLHI
jgi:hypothetical protein